MITEYPDYYKCFKCIADRCPKTCCAGWEIGIDEETYYFYQTVKGKTKEKLDRYLKEDAEGFHFELTKEGRCPFLNEKNLCELYMEFGERGMSITCKEHPRFITECGDYCQIDISLSCPEANRLFFNSVELPEIYKDEKEFSAEKLSCVEKNKRKSILKKRNERLKSIEKTDSMYSLLERWYKEENLNILEEPKRIDEFLALQEIRDDSWKEKVIGKVQKNNISEIINRNEKWSRKLIFYFLFRYTMDEFFGTSSRETLLTALRSTVLILILSLELEKDLGDAALPIAARMFSSEVEYSEKNIKLIRSEKPSEFR